LPSILRIDYINNGAPNKTRIKYTKAIEPRKVLAVLKPILLKSNSLQTINVKITLKTLILTSDSAGEFKSIPGRKNAKILIARKTIFIQKSDGIGSG
jgi:hypothetical protein